MAQPHERKPAPPDDLRERLTAAGIATCDEVAPRRAPERHVPGYNLFRLTPAAAKRWKCHYRILLAAGYYDARAPPRPTPVPCSPCCHTNKQGFEKSLRIPHDFGNRGSAGGLEKRLT